MCVCVCVNMCAKYCCGKYENNMKKKNTTKSILFIHSDGDINL